VRIETIDVYRVAMPLVYPFRTAYGDSDLIESVLVKLTSEGKVGWGEGTSWAVPNYSPECARAQYIISRDFVAPLLLGEDVESGDELQERLASIKGNFFAKATFDMAWWDLHAKRLGKPLWRVIGGEDPVVDVGADFGVMETLDLLIETIGTALSRGYKRVKLKFRPGWDVNMVAAVRGTFPDAVFHIDCNSAYTLDDLPMFRELDRYGLAMIEQPLMFDDLIDHAALRQQVETPICLDESITSLGKARKAIQVGACDWINIKPPRVGGLTNAIKIHNLAMAQGVPCWVGGMLESALGASHCLALATLPNNLYPADVFPTSRYFERDLGSPPMEHSGVSQFTASSEPGVGVAPDPEMLRRESIEHVAFGA
jgi:o-succinylbenzoate synthase